jgi:LmbE family N-acetylglucosaminyl deacetylase
LILSIAALIAIAPAAAAPPAPEPTAAEPATADFPQLDASTSLLVVSPHPDDEVLCCAGAIQRVLQAGGRASIVWITSGDGSEIDLLLIERSLFIRPKKLRDLAARRMQEARNAATILGVPAEQQIFLGYPDRGVLSLLTDHYVTPYHSKFSGGTSVPYPAALFPGHPYTGESLERDFEAVLERVRPTLILAPSPRDTHPDHRATGMLAIRAMSRRDELSKLRYWIVHGGKGWPRPRGLNLTLAETASPRSRGLAPIPFQLNADEQARKLAALRVYHTQMQVMSSFLLAFVRTTELYSALPVPDGVASRK